MLPANTPSPVRGTAIETPPALATTLTTPGVVRTTALTTVPEPTTLGCTLAPRISGAGTTAERARLRGAAAVRCDVPVTGAVESAGGGTAGVRRGAARGETPAAGRAVTAAGVAVPCDGGVRVQAARPARVTIATASVRTMVVLPEGKSESGRTARTPWR